MCILCCNSSQLHTKNTFSPEFEVLQNSVHPGWKMWTSRNPNTSRVCMLLPPPRHPQGRACLYWAPLGRVPPRTILPCLAIFQMNKSSRYVCLDKTSRILAFIWGGSFIKAFIIFCSIPKKKIIYIHLLTTLD